LALQTEQQSSGLWHKWILFWWVIMEVGVRHLFLYNFNIHHTHRYHANIAHKICKWELHHCLNGCNVYIGTQHSENIILGLPYISSSKVVCNMNKCYSDE
jgi:hypothetical protein